MINENKENKEESIRLYGKIAVMPKNAKAAQSLTFLEKIKISKQKLWYIIIENQTENDEEIKMIKYNNRKGVNLKIFVENLKTYYAHNELMKEYVENLEIEGGSVFSIIKNIPNVEINGKKLLSIIMEDLIKLLK
jgi:hypothetical protein